MKTTQKIALLLLCSFVDRVVMQAVLIHKAAEYVVLFLVIQRVIVCCVSLSPQG